jgi:hypothetical protein
MKRIGVVGHITDHSEGVLASFEAEEPQAHLGTCDVCHTSFRQSLQVDTPLGKIPEISLMPAKGRLELSATIRQEQSQSSKHMPRNPREIAEITVRVSILAGIIWFVLVWTGVAVPTQKYHEYTIDFSRQLTVRGGSSLPSTLPSVIPCAPLQLAMHLGRGNRPGPFDVDLVQDGMRCAFASGIVKLENHEPILRVKLDLSQVPAGESQLGIRPAGGEWRYYKVMLKSTH